MDHDLDDADVLTELGAQVIALPGHPVGSIVLFTGDIAAEHDGQVILGPFQHRP